MGHWHVGWHVLGNEAESYARCFTDIREAGFAFHRMLREAGNAIPPAVAGSNRQHRRDLEWLARRPGLLLLGDLQEQRRLSREVRDGYHQPAVYWAGEADGNPLDCELWSGGELE